MPAFRATADALISSCMRKKRERLVVVVLKAVEAHVLVEVVPPYAKCVDGVLVALLGCGVVEPRIV